MEVTQKYTLKSEKVQVLKHPWVVMPTQNVAYMIS